MNLLYGAEYSDGIIAFQILIWTVAIIWINTVYGRGLLGCDKQKHFLLGTATAAISNIILNLILMPPFGLVGAAIATVSAEGFALIVFYVEFRKVARVPFARHIFKPFLACVIMSSFLYWGLNSANLNLFLLIFGGAAIYFLFLFLMKGIAGEEIRLIRSLVPPK